MSKRRDLSADAKLKGIDYMGFFSGAGTGIPNAIVSAFLLIFYSNVLYMELTEVSLVMAISKVFDGVSDLLMGRIIDKTKSRYGKARPWYIRMILPTVAAMLLLFWMPAGIRGTWRLIYIFFTYNFASTICFTANAVAHSSMIGFMTLNTKSRGTVGVLSMIANTIATLLVANGFLKISRLFGNGDAYTQKGFTLTVIIYMLLYALGAGVAFLLTRERINNVGNVEEEKGATSEGKNEDAQMPADPPLGAALKSLFTNRYWILCVMMCLGFYFLMTYSMSVTVYFAQYILNDIDMQGTLTSMLYVFILIGIVLILPVMQRIGKRNTMAIGLVVSAVGWFMPQFSLNHGFVTAAAIVVGIGFGCIAAPAGSFLQDTLTYGTWKSGVTAIGMGNAVFSFVNKLSSAWGTIVLGIVLDIGGFEASLSVQPDSAIRAIRLLYIWLPTAICLVVAMLSAFYDLDKKLPIIEKEIKAGRIGEKKDKELRL